MSATSLQLYTETFFCFRFWTAYVFFFPLELVCLQLCSAQREREGERDSEVVADENPSCQSSLCAAQLCYLQTRFLTDASCRISPRKGEKGENLSLSLLQSVAFYLTHTHTVLLYWLVISPVM